MSNEVKIIDDYIEQAKLRIDTAKDTFKDLDLDTINELDEGIMIKRVPDSKIVLKREDGSPDSIRRELDIIINAPDWTFNKPKAKQLLDMLDKQTRTIEQVLHVFRQHLDIAYRNEAKINKILGKQQQETLKVYLFRRLVRMYFGDRISLQDLIKKLDKMHQFTVFLKSETEWLIKTVYDDEKIDKLIAQKTKMNIFSFMQIIKASEITVKCLTMQSICSQLFNELQIVQILYKDKYPDYSMNATLEDVHFWQKSIRKGSKRDIIEVLESSRNLATPPKSYCLRNFSSNEVVSNQDPKEKDYIFPDSPMANNQKFLFSPSRSPAYAPF